jgi:FxsC-like protein
VAKFFYVAARRDELDAGDARRDCYGAIGGRDWQPFYPPLPRNVAFIAQEVTGRNNFYYEVEDLDEDIRSDLEKANQDNVVAVVVVDAWSLRLQRYRALMSQCDSVSLQNTIFLVVRNAEDKSVESYKSDLELRLKLAFPTKATRPDRAYFINPVETPKEFQKHLREAIIKAKRRILEYGELKRQIEGAEGSLPRLPASGATV